MSTKETRQQIEYLTEHNFSSWFVNIRAELRSKKLWKYTQEVYKSESAEEATTTEEGQPERTLSRREERAIKEWEDKCQESADLMTPTISPGIQLKLTEADFNNGFLMLTKLRLELQPSGNSEFMRLSKEYYTLQFKAFKSMPEYLTRIKVLEEKIDSTKITLDSNNRTVLCLSMSLPPEYQYLIQIWATMPTPITAEKARQMVLEASRQHHQALHNDPGLAMRAEQGQREKCKYCGSDRHYHEKCWQEHPEQAPEWFKEKMKAESGKDGKAGKQARRFQARLAHETRGDDFTDSGTHFSALAMS